MGKRGVKFITPKNELPGVTYKATDIGNGLVLMQKAVLGSVWPFEFPPELSLGEETKGKKS